VDGAVERRSNAARAQQADGADRSHSTRRHPASPNAAAHRPAVGQRTGQRATPYERAIRGPRTVDNGRRTAPYERAIRGPRTVDNGRRTAINSGCVMSTGPTTSDERSDAQRLRRPAASSVVQRPARDGASSVVRRPWCATSASSLPASGASNKPMVPTAHDGPSGNSIDPMRRHIGQPFGGFSERRPGERGVGPRTKFEGRATRGMHAVGGNDRVLDNGLRAA